MSLLKIIIITVIVFLFLLWFNYMGAVGRIERRNQATGTYRDFGPVTKKEEAAYFEGTHKKLAFRQAIIGSFIWSLIIFLFLYYELFELLKKIF